MWGLKSDEYYSYVAGRDGSGYQSYSVPTSQLSIDDENYRWISYTYILDAYHRKYHTWMFWMNIVVEYYRWILWMNIIDVAGDVSGYPSYSVPTSQLSIRDENY